jgi:hypothetical protein
MKSIKEALVSAAVIVILMMTACGPESSPEGRMTTKIESLQKEMIDRQEKQNAAILDSLAALRKDIQALQQQK